MYVATKDVVQVASGAGNRLLGGEGIVDGSAALMRVGRRETSWHTGRYVA